MRKFKVRKLKFRKVAIHEISDKLLIVNLYVTQGLTLLLAMILFLFQLRNPIEASIYVGGLTPLLWGAGFAIVVLFTDILVDAIVPKQLLDDGGINEKLFRARPLWHIALIAAVVAICEELLFRGAIQPMMGPYWTSILFAAIHFRYLRHWIMTAMVFGISYGLGWMVDVTGTLWTAIIAHFFIDFISGCIIRYRRQT